MKSPPGILPVLANHAEPSNTACQQSETLHPRDFSPIQCIALDIPDFVKKRLIV